MISGAASEDLAMRLSERLQCDCIKSATRIFPDGEGKTTLDSTPPAGTLVVVQSTCPPVDSNMLQALSLIHTARKHSRNVIAVVPYMGYARQDREFLPGEIITLEVIADLLQKAGAAKVITVDIHSKIGLDRFGIPVTNVSAIPELAAYFGQTHLRDPLVVSPDLGGSERAGRFATLVGLDHTVLTKRRDRTTGMISVEKKDLQVVGRDVILVDDMISTGGSIVKSAEFLQSRGCGRILVACTHALLVDGAESRLLDAGVKEIVCTNTIPGAVCKVDVSGIIAEAI